MTPHSAVVRDRLTGRAELEEHALPLGLAAVYVPGPRTESPSDVPLERPTADQLRREAAARARSRFPRSHYPRPRSSR